MTKAGKPARRTQAQRRKETRERVLKAALKLLREQGESAFTTTKVAAMAGVSRGAQENHFRTRFDLIAAAGRYAMDQAAEHGREMAERAAASRDPFATFLADSKHFFFSPAFFAMLELALGGRADQRLARIHAELFTYVRGLLDTIWTDALAGAGYPRKRIKLVLDLTNYLLRGMALAELCLPVKPNVGRMMKEWEPIALAVLAPQRRAAKR